MGRITRSKTLRLRDKWASLRPQSRQWKAVILGPRADRLGTEPATLLASVITQIREKSCEFRQKRVHLKRKTKLVKAAGAVVTCAAWFRNRSILRT
jgi:hypothetical protein